MRSRRDRARARRARGSLLLVLLLLLPLDPARADSGPKEASQDPERAPLEALREVVQRSLSGPALRALEAELEAEAAASRLLASPGSPYAELELEGIEGSLDRAPHAANYLRLGLPFNGPGQAKRSRSLLEGMRLHAASASKVAALELGVQAAADWLDLAAAADRLSVRRSQLDRLERAVSLQRRRVELGELAGAALLPLELELVRHVSLVQELEAERAFLAAGIEELTGGPFPLPAQGDLARLRAGIGPFAWDEAELEARLASSPYLERSGLAVERARLEGEQGKALVRGRPTVELSWENFPALEGLESYNSLGFALNVPLPLGKLERHQQAEAQARLRQSEAEAEVLRRELRARVQRWARIAEAAGRSLEATEGLESELPRADHSLDEQFRLGAIDYLVYLDGLARLDEVRIRSIDGRLAELRARLVLASLVSDPGLFPLPEPAQETLP